MRHYVMLIVGVLLAGGSFGYIGAGHAGAHRHDASSDLAQMIQTYDLGGIPAAVCAFLGIT